MSRDKRINELSISPDEKTSYITTFSLYQHHKDEKEEYWRLTQLLPKSQHLIENRYSPRHEVKCLFVLVGTTLEPLLLSILTIRPKEKLVLIYSKESETCKNKIRATLLKTPGGHNTIPARSLVTEAKDFIQDIPNKDFIKDSIVTDTSPEKVFAAIKSQIGEYEPHEVGVDITGGKKSMVGGGFLAAAINHFQLFYLDFDEYEDTEPVQGSEFIHLLENPYDIYNIDLIIQAKKLFQHHNYQDAFQLFSDIETKLSPQGIEKPAKYGLGEERDKITKMKKAAECLMHWDRFDFIMAQDKKVADLSRELTERLFVLSSIKKREEIFDSKNFYPYILDRYLSAMRDQSTGDLNDALVRYAQVIELATEFYLTKGGFVPRPSSPNISAMFEMIENGGGTLSKPKPKQHITFNDIVSEEIKALFKTAEDVSEQRNGFIHRGIAVGSSDINTASDSAKALLLAVCQKTDTDFQADFKKYAFPTEFDDDGILKYASCP